MNEITLPEYGDREGVRSALAQIKALMDKKKNELRGLMATASAVRAMCEHEMVTDSDPRCPTRSCKHCGHTPGAHFQITVGG